MEENEKDMIEMDESLGFDETASSPVAAETPKPNGYGVPQPLFEDIIPNNFAMDEKKRREAQELAERAAAAANARAAKEEAALSARAERERVIAEAKAAKEAAKEAKRQAKEDKKKARVLSMIEEAQVPAQQPYTAPMAAPTAPVAPMAPVPPVAPVIPVAPVAPAQQVAPIPPVAPAPTPVAPVQAQAPAAPTQNAAPVPVASAPMQKFSPYEKKLRRKYRMDKDRLLSSNEVLPGFVLAKGENVVRSYQCLKRGAGSICLTNKRLLINAGERSELEIDKVSGIKFCKYTIFSFVKCFFWFLFFVIGAALIALPFFRTSLKIPAITTGSNWKKWFTIVFFSCGGASLLISLPFLLTMIKKPFYFFVYAQLDSPFVEAKNGFYAKRERKRKGFRYDIRSKAGKECAKAARELGALILEVKEGRYDY